jgi:hypothetical protein
MPLPEYKPGDYLECGKDESFSRVLVLSENKVLVKDGPATGDVMSLDEWYFIVGDARSTIRHSTYFDIPKVDIPKVDIPIPKVFDIPIPKVDTLCVYVPVPLMRLPSIRSPSLHVRSRLADSRILRQTQTTIPVVVPPAKRTWNQWFFSVFLCGVNE